MKPKTRRTSDPLRDEVARFLLAGFDGLPNGDLNALPDPVGSEIFDLFCNTAAARALFVQHEAYLRRRAGEWQINPAWEAAGRSYFYAEPRPDGPVREWHG